VENTVVKRYEEEPIAQDLSPEAVQSEVERILASDKFARSKRLRSLLRFTVNQTLQGHADTLKEYVIGTEVLKKPDSYDPRRDSLVRVLASRLRVKLKEYYNDGGSDDPLVIEFPKGKYVPRFQRREQLQTELEKKLRARNAHSLGNFLLARSGEESLSEAVERFAEAAESDPDWAPGRVQYALASAYQGFLGHRRPRDVWPDVRAQAEAALELDEMSPDAHIALGMFHAFYNWRWRDADSHFQRAIDRDSYSGAGHLWRAIASFLPFGKLREAQQEIDAARELAPAPFLEEGRLLVLYFSGQHEDIIRETLQNSQPQRNVFSSVWRTWMRGCALAATGRIREAIELLSGVQDDNSRVIATLGHLYAVTGDRDSARQMSARLEERRASGAWVPNYDRALIAAGLGDHEEAMSMLQEAIRENEPWMVYLSLDPRMGALRSIPRFGGFVRRVVSSEATGEGATPEAAANGAVPSDLETQDSEE
jgi:tetratricopeptide (TPR) repeat protein